MNGKLVDNRAGVFCLAVLVAACVTVTRVDAGGSEPEKAERSVSMKDLPGPVKASAERAVAGGKVKRIVMEREDGKDAYSVEATVAGKDKEFTFALDGMLLAEEEDLAFAELPEAVRVAAGEYFGGDRGLSASSETAKSVTSYEIEGTKAGKKLSVKFSAGGALLDAEADED